MNDADDASGVVRIGKYRITRVDEWVWISIADDGEGGGFPESEVEAVIDAYYKERF